MASMLMVPVNHGLHGDVPQGRIRARSHGCRDRWLDARQPLPELSDGPANPVYAHNPR